MKKTAIFIIIILILYVLLNGMNASAKMIPDEAIRLRVIPNSNSEYDQTVKQMVKQELQTDMYELLQDTKGIKEARSVIVNQLSNIDQKINHLLEGIGYREGYTIDYGYHYFPDKEFEGITYEEGEYESLLITLGKGEGDNWWCVLFPPLCLVEVEENDSVEYKFFLQEFFEKYL